MARVTKKRPGSSSGRKSVRPAAPIAERTVPTGIPEIDHGKVNTEGLAAPEPPPARRAAVRRRHGARHAE